MDLTLIKQKLAASQNKGKPVQKVDYSKIFWKPKVGKYQVRILPSKFDKSNPFREVYLHYGFAKGPILALNNWGEKDPIIEFAKQLRKSSDKEDWQLAKKIEPKIRYFAPVIVRGEEDKGARLWEFGKLTYEQLLGIASDEDYGDYTDITEGRDFTIDAVEDTVANKKVIKCNLRVKPKTTSISEDAALIETVLNEQPDILAINKHYSFEDLQEILNKWLNPDETSEESETPVASATEEEDENGDLPWEKPQTTSKYSSSPEETKTSHADKFDSLFE